MRTFYLAMLITLLQLTNSNFLKGQNGQMVFLHSDEGDVFTGTLNDGTTDGIGKNGKFDLNGNGTYVYHTGGKFVGLIEHTKPIKGTYYWPTGDSFEGVIKSLSPWAGEGTYYFKSGDKFVGVCANGKPYTGTYFFANSSTPGIKLKEGIAQ
jgi:hypothetical protein